MAHALARSSPSSSQGEADHEMAQLLLHAASQLPRRLLKGLEVPEGGIWDCVAAVARSTVEAVKEAEAVKGCGAAVRGTEARYGWLEKGQEAFPLGSYRSLCETAMACSCQRSLPTGAPPRGGKRVPPGPPLVLGVGPSDGGGNEVLFHAAMRMLCHGACLGMGDYVYGSTLMEDVATIAAMHTAGDGEQGTIAAVAAEALAVCATEPALALLAAKFTWRLVRALPAARHARRWRLLDALILPYMDV